MEFGDILWIAVFLILSFGGSIIKKLAAKGEDSVESSQPVSYPEWETEAADFEEEIKEEPVAQASPYFTYEDPMVEVRTSAPVMPVAPEVVAQPAMLGGEAFDLRKAVIYQTIMQNDYIYE